MPHCDPSHNTVQNTYFFKQYPVEAPAVTERLVSC